MGKRNTLREVKGLGTVSKPKQQLRIKPKPEQHLIPVACEEWQAWQCRGDNTNPANWHQTWEGSFEDCFATVEENVSCQIDELLNRDGSLDAVLYKYEDEPDTLTKILEGMYDPRIEQIKTECLQSGGYRGDTWALALTSQSTKFRPPEAKGIFTHSDLWTGWEQVGQNASDPKSWRLIVDGSLSKCLEGMGFFVNIDIEMATEGQLTDDMDIGDFFRYKMHLRSKLVEEIERVCLIKGEFKSCGWTIYSVKTEEECWSIVRSISTSSS